MKESKKQEMKERTNGEKCEIEDLGERRRRK